MTKIQSHSAEWAHGPPWSQKCLSAREQWLTVCSQGWDSITEIRPISWIQTRSHFTHTHTHTHTRARMMCQGQLTRLHLRAVWLPSGLYTASFWRYLPVAEWMFAFRHLLGPSAHNINSCQVSFYTVTSTESTERMPEECHCLRKCFRNLERSSNATVRSHFRFMREVVFKNDQFRRQKVSLDSCLTILPLTN